MSKGRPGTRVGLLCWRGTWRSSASLPLGKLTEADEDHADTSHDFRDHPEFSQTHDALFLFCELVREVGDDEDDGDVEARVDLLLSPITGLVAEAVIHLDLLLFGISRQATEVIGSFFMAGLYTKL